ncbi:biotin--[acetyl-CoA-carboxylase] ligase [uncultured Nocardioides sp.]|uniref:biotin--[acetyl-CoA-carboxylase] ligase n=1 Tax=uncultured Nocardioides sp. TaxID=198441 RepID=UPI00262B213D|nr:biotin--[acetyl-CoA-carboxylase] ligase [uncultured Nocardioides sp.]
MLPASESRPPLDPRRLGSDVLPTGLLPGLRVEVVEATPSTNADAAARAAAGEEPGLVLVTEHQTAGRGRLDRVWTTPPRACLTFSTLLRPDVPMAHWPWLPLLTGYAVAAALRTHLAVPGGPDPVGLKWPNDVLLDERKVAGILVERHEAPGGPVAVVGIGLNVTLRDDELPVPHATSLLLAGGPVPDREDLLLSVLAELAAAYDAWRAEPTGSRLRASYAAACTTVGRRVRVELPVGPPLVGTAVDVDPGGRLVVDDGVVRRPVGAGDVVHVRPA